MFNDKISMEYVKFKAFVDCLSDMTERNRKAYKIGVDMIDYTEPYDKAITILLEEILTIEGNDWLSWFLYEKGGIDKKMRKDMKAWDNEKEICKDLKGLHSYLVDNSYFRNTLK